MSPLHEHRPARERLIRRPWQWGLLFAALLGYYLLLALNRQVDGDEGYFLYAGRLVLEGQLPYRDFFYPQWPLLPFFWADVLGYFNQMRWIGARIAIAILCTLTAMIFLSLLGRRIRHRGVFWSMAAVYLTSDFGMEYATVAMSLLPSMAPVLLAWWMACHFFYHGWRRDAPSAVAGDYRFTAVGLMVALATLARLTVAPFIVLFAVLLGLVMRRSGRRLLPSLAWYALGVAIPFALLLWLIWPAADAFVWSTWRYHMMHPENWKTWAFRWPIIRQAAVINVPWLACFFLIGWERIRGERPLSVSDLYYWGGAAITVATAIAPRGMQSHYFSQATPWLLLAAAPAAEAALLRLGRPLWKRQKVRAIGLILIMIAAFAIEPMRRLEYKWPQWSWKAETRVAAAQSDWSIATLRAVSDEIDRLAPPGAKLLTWWPGYALQSHTRLYPGLENHFGLRFSKYYPPQVSHLVGVMTVEEMDALIQARDPDIIVVGIWAGQEAWLDAGYYQSFVEQAGYVERARIGNARIYLRR